MFHASLLVLATALCQGASVGATPPPIPSKPPVAPPVSAKDQAEKKHAEDVKRDSDLGKKYAEQVEKELKLSKNAEYQARVETIGGQFADIANESAVKVLWGDSRLNRFEYHFKVIEGPDVNAFSLPGGYIFIYEGLLKYIESDDELAGVLAHEISHASFRHLATLQREESKMSAITLPLILIAIFSGGRAGAELSQLGQLIGLATGSGWSQKAEESADYGGFQYMLKSRYNPVAMLTFMERLAADDKVKDRIDWGIYRTHPPNRERANQLMLFMGQAGVPIKRSLVTTSYRTILKPADGGKVEAWFSGRRVCTFAGQGAQERATEAAKRLDGFMDGVPELFDVTASDSGILYGKGKALFRVSEDDAKAEGVSVPETIRRTVQSVKRSLYQLTYRIWDPR